MYIKSLALHTATCRLSPSSPYPTPPPPPPSLPLSAREGPQEGYKTVVVERQPVFIHPHDLLVDDDSLYVAQFASNQTYPIKLERI